MTEGSGLILKEVIENDIKSLDWGFIGYKQPLQAIVCLIDNQLDGILFNDYHNLKIIRGN